MLNAALRHEPGLWKQNNKVHRSLGHRSKREIHSQNKGRVNVKTISKRPKISLHRIDRRNQANQMRKKKREEAISFKRSIGVGQQSPPHITALIPLHQNVDITTLSKMIKTCISSDDAIASEPPLTSAGYTANIPRLRHRFQIVEPGTASFSDILNCAMVADTLLFLVACNDAEPMDDHGHNILSCLLAQGVPSTGIRDLAVKSRNSVKKDIIKKLEQYTPNARFYVADQEQEIFNMLRSVAEIKRQKLGIRQKRPYLLVEKQEFIGEDVGTLKVCGHIRGFPLDVNQLVHLVGWGDFQISCIEEVAEHCPWNIRRIKNKNEIEDKKVNVGGKSFHPWEATGRSIECDPSKQQDVVAEAQVDPMEGEQTWPTEEEIRDAEESIKRTKKLAKKVPEGTSEYQAAWILDSDEEWEDVESEEEDEAMEEELEPREDEVSQADDASVIMTESVMTDQQSHVDVEDDPKEVALFREERSHQEFPDEVDTPMDVPARTRFQKYRGLQSFRHSPWDPQENLPIEYARIFQFQSFNRTKKRVKAIKCDETTSFEPGCYVIIHLKNVPRSYVTNHPATSPLTLFGLLPHEQKMSVLHFAIKQTGSETIKNKTELLFHVGFRKFRAKPIFSEHTSGSKHKMERFFPKEGVTIATVFAPIMFPPANVLVFKDSPAGDCHLVATGALYKIDPNRIVTKRIVLSGHPFRIHKRGAVIRYMFFNRDDVLWFKPVELRTKWGRRGHIREPIGTHGHMKCIFDDHLVSQDTILMTLYKRVFPKWSYEAVTPLRVISHNDDEMFNEELFDE